MLSKLGCISAVGAQCTSLAYIELGRPNPHLLGRPQWRRDEDHDVSADEQHLHLPLRHLYHDTALMRVDGDRWYSSDEGGW